MTENDLDSRSGRQCRRRALFAKSSAADVTTAHIQCDACGSVGAVGSLHCYAAPMGVVLRCSNCAAIASEGRSARPHGRWLEMRARAAFRVAPTFQRPGRFRKLRVAEVHTRSW